jgi:hypothetical protein
MKNEESDPLGVGKYDEFTGGVVSDLDVVLDPSLVEPIETKTLSERLEIELNKQEVKGEEVIRQPKKWPVATDEQRDTAHEHDPAQFGHVEEGKTRAASIWTTCSNLLLRLHRFLERNCSSTLSREFWTSTTTLSGRLLCSSRMTSLMEPGSI